MQKPKACIGIDQSYNNFGLAVAVDGKIKYNTSYKFSTKWNKADERAIVQEKLKRVIYNLKNKKEIDDIKVIFERIRTFSQQKGKSQGFGIKPVYMIETGKMLGTIIDTTYQLCIDCYSVDTRSWKSKIVGSSKSINGDTKILTIQYVENVLGIDCKLYNKDGEVLKYMKGKYAGKIKYNDDMADAICIALYGFIPEKYQKLQIER